MSLLLNKKLIKSLRNIFYPILILIIFIEFFFQIIFFFDIKSLKKTILYFNPYCDQSYWDFEGNSLYDDNKYSYHPILTIINKKNEVFFNKIINNNKKDLIFYGSSFIGHKYFISNFNDKTNFAVKSYGIDQIYKSYDLTKQNFLNDTIVIGFLLEDIDRALFYQRNFPKLKYIKNNDTFQLTNTPVKFRNELKTGIHFYFYNFIKNISFLIFNDFNYKLSECDIQIKKDIFEYFINEIIYQSNQLNQNLIFVTFNFKDDLKKPGWRYEFVKNLLYSKNVNHIDVLEIINSDMSIKNLSLEKYYNSEDFHLSMYGFNLVKNHINDFILQYK